ncbi:hypothetical protein TYRP_000696 [Tyrophagus putrescentiae]|nr:hypothetical protein TYRP_000696 [Tyrophagus putrescentiae]
MDDNVKFITDFEDINIPGKRYLRETLSTCTEPMVEIEEFQMKNGIILPSLRSGLPLLDLHKIPRHTFHNAVMENLREKLINRIEEINKKMDPKESDRKLKELLHKSFPLIKIPTLEPVCMALLKNIDVVEEKYLKLLYTEKKLYDKCDVSVKRHIWQEHQSMFGDEVTPLLITYIKEKEAIFANIKDSGKTFFALSPKVRRQNEVLQTLAKMVGKNVLLYDTILQFLRTIFLHTHNAHYCTLRVSLLMELHDANVTDITSMDPCHKFAWCLDACIRERAIESKRSRELQGFLEGVTKNGNERVLGDLAMALADPYAVNFIATQIIRILYHQINNEALPREHNVLHFLLRLLNLGLNAYDILKDQDFKEPPMDVGIVTKFLPILMSFMVDDSVRSVNARLPPDDRESALTIIEHSGPPPDAFSTYIAEDRLAAVLAIYYTANVARQKDRQAVTRVFGCLSAAHDGRTFEDQYLHYLVYGLICLGEEFSNEELCSVVFDEIFLPPLAHAHGSTIIHLIKLIWHVHPHLEPSRLSSLMQTIGQIAHHPEGAEGIKTIFQELEERIAKAAADKEKEAAAAAGGGGTTASSTSTTSTASSSTAGSSGDAMMSRPMMTPAYMTPSMSPSPSMSPFSYGPSPGSPFSPGPPMSPAPPMSPMPYASPFHHPSMHGQGSSSGHGGSSGQY